MSDRKPRILLGVTISMSLGLMRELPEYLADRGWDVHLVSSRGPEQESLRGLDSISVHSVTMARDPSLMSDLKSLWAWIRLLREVRPDLVSVGTPKAGLLGGIAAWLTRVPARVYILRGLRLETVSGASRAVLAALERVSMAAVQAVLSVSPSLRSEAVALRLASPDKIVVLGAGSSNGVNLGHFGPRRISDAEVGEHRRALGLDASIPVVGFVGRLTPDKGLRPFAEARRLLVERGIDHQVLIVGQTEATGEDELRHVRKSGRPPVETGAVSDTAPYYRLMDVLCLPTLREGFPNVVLEAAASGIPAVTTNATGAIDSVIDGQTGLIAQAGSGESLADALAAIITDAGSRTRMGIAARERVEREFDRRVVFDRIEAFYRSQLSAARREIPLPAESPTAT